jgi:hypothetical protein
VVIGTRGDGYAGASQYPYCGKEPGKPDLYHRHAPVAILAGEKR